MYPGLRLFRILESPYGIHYPKIFKTLILYQASKGKFVKYYCNHLIIVFYSIVINYVYIYFCILYIYFSNVFICVRDTWDNRLLKVLLGREGGLAQIRTNERTMKQRKGKRRHVTSEGLEVGINY